uniref:(northern house mosquito) hypothetical protein n=1 Tax=Culex pipiens TaxID=7175 RepID=A0A8D8CK94_CULPI
MANIDHIRKNPKTTTPANLRKPSSITNKDHKTTRNTGTISPSPEQEPGSRHYTDSVRNRISPAGFDVVDGNAMHLAADYKKTRNREPNTHRSPRLARQVP